MQTTMRGACPLGGALACVREAPLFFAIAGLTWAFCQSCTFPDYQLPNSRCDRGAAMFCMGGTGAVGGAGNGAQADFGVGGATPQPGALDGPYRLVATHSSKCADADGAPTIATHPSVQQLTCSAVPAQSFTLHGVGDGYYTIATADGSDCIDVEGGATENGTSLIRAPCAGVDGQRWLVVPQDDGSFLLVNGLTSKCADVPNGSHDEHLILEQWTCNAGANQRWSLSSLTPKSLPFVIDESFGATSWKGTGTAMAQVTPTASSKTTDCDGDRAPAARGDCHIVAFDTLPAGSTYGGASWLYPRDNWGSLPGLAMASGASRVSFQARGMLGGEVVQIEAGGVTGGVFVDSFHAGPQSITLTSDWHTYSLELPSVDYAGGVLSGFACGMNFGAGAAPLRFYVDDIVWE
jgi:Ricin-type beta-trefoil lectin domain